MCKFPIQITPKFYKTLEICDKAVNRCFTFFWYFSFVPDQNKYQKIYERVIHKDNFMFKYFLNRYKTQKMRDEAVDDCLEASKIYF